MSERLIRERETELFHMREAIKGYEAEITKLRGEITNLGHQVKMLSATALAAELDASLDDRNDLANLLDNAHSALFEALRGWELHLPSGGIAYDGDRERIAELRKMVKR